MKYFLLAVLLFFTGCAGMAKPETFKQRLTYVVATAEATATTTSDLYKREVISREKAIVIKEQLELVNITVSNARLAFGSGDEKTAVEFLNRANLILIQLEKQLKEAQNGKQSSNTGRIPSNSISGPYQLCSNFAECV